MYNSLLLPWSSHPTPAETLYRTSSLVRTKGTVFLLPPPNITLREAYNSPPRPQTRMSAGAVALCKHFERGGASSEHGRAHPFWTLPRGSNEEKTRVAEEILERMLREARWRNVMMLHEGVAVYEIRNGRGYGMRWTLEVETVGGRGEQRSGEDDELIRDNNENGNDETDVNFGELRTKRTTFRGLLEPIAGLDHELELEDEIKLR